MRTCLVVCATKSARACDAAARIANTLRARGVAVDLECGRDVSDLSGYDAVVVGAPLCHGRWQRAARRFVRRHRMMLEATDVAIFVSGPCDDGDAYDRSWNRVIKILTRLGWLDPVRIEVLPEHDLHELSCSKPTNGSRAARWSQNLSVAMHLSDSDAPHSEGQV